MCNGMMINQLTNQVKNDAGRTAYNTPPNQQIGSNALGQYLQASLRQPNTSPQASWQKFLNSGNANSGSPATSGSAGDAGGTSSSDSVGGLSAVDPVTANGADRTVQTPSPIAGLSYDTYGMGPEQLFYQAGLPALTTS